MSDLSVNVNVNVQPTTNDVWTVQQLSDSKALANLGDKYELQFNEAHSELIIVNKLTGEKTTISGDPHVDWNGDGKAEVDFWGTTTFKLEDGTKVTINTVDAGNGMTLASKATITNGDNAIVVTGLDSKNAGDLRIAQSCDGRSLDRCTRDGFVVDENANGVGWNDAGDGKLVTREDFERARDNPSSGPDAYLNSPVSWNIGISFAAQSAERNETTPAKPANSTTPAAPATVADAAG